MIVFILSLPFIQVSRYEKKEIGEKEVEFIERW